MRNLFFSVPSCGDFFGAFSVFPEAEDCRCRSLPARFFLPLLLVIVHWSRGSKIEKDLESLTTEGEKIDEKLVKMEGKHLVGNALSKPDIKVASTWCHDMADVMKRGGKKATALKAWFAV